MWCYPYVWSSVEYVLLFNSLFCLKTHYQFGPGMKSLISSWLPSSVLIVVSATNSVPKGKNIRGREQEGEQQEAQIYHLSPFALITIYETSWLFLVILNSPCQSASKRRAASQAEVRQCYHPFIVMVKSTFKLQDWEKCTFAGKRFRCVRADAHT